MANRIAGLSIEIDGNTTKLNRALAGVNKEVKDTKAQLRDVERLLKLDPANTELLAQKQRLLGSAVSSTKTKLDELKNAEAQVQAQFARGEISQAQYDGLQREISATEAELKRLEQAAAASNSKLIAIAGTADKLSAGFGKVATAMAPVTLGLAAVGAASFKMAADVEDAVGATIEVYKGASDAVQEWAANLESYYGIAYGEALEYANMMGSMLQNIGGLTEQEAAAQAQTLIELAGDLTAMYGGTTADAVHALTGALKGNNTMLDNYGMAVNDAMVRQKALEMGLVSTTSEMGLQERQAATLALIMEQSAAAQGQAARESDGASGSMRAFTTEIKNLASSLGEVLLPIITPIIKKISEFVEWFGSLDKGTQSVIVKMGLLVAAISPVSKVISGLSGGVSTLTTKVFPALNRVLDKIATIGMPQTTRAAGNLGDTARNMGGSMTTAGRSAGNLGKNLDGAGTAAQGANMKFLSFAAGIAAIAAGLAVAVLAVSQLVKAFGGTGDSALKVAGAVGIIIGAVTAMVAAISALGKLFQNSGVQFVMYAAGITIISAAMSILMLAMERIIKVANDSGGSIMEVANALTKMMAGVMIAVAGIAMFGMVANRALPGIMMLSLALMSVAAAYAAIAEAQKQINYGKMIDAGVNPYTMRAGGAQMQSLPMMAKGGILSRGSSIVGEKGPELLSIVSGGRAQVTPLTSNSTRGASGATGTVKNYNIGNISIPADTVRSFVDILNIMESESESIQAGYVGG